MALSSRTITASINYRCAPFSATLMHRGRRAALKTPSDACAEDCRGKLIWPRCPINACSPWCVPIITLRESVLTTKPRQRFSAVTCCTSNVNPPIRFLYYDLVIPFVILTLPLMAQKREHLTPIFQQNEILFGHDSTPGLIAFEVVGNNKAKIFRRQDGRIETELAPFRPFMLLEGEGALKDWKGEAELQKLDGQGAFNRLALFPDLNQLEHARFHAQKKSGKISSGPDAPYRYFSDPLHQFLILSGKTHFLGMTFGNLRSEEHTSELQS